MTRPKDAREIEESKYYSAMPEINEVPEVGVQDDGAGEDVAEAGTLAKLLKILLPVVLVSLGGGGYLAYMQYTNLAEAAVSMGIEFGFDSGSDEDAPIEYGQFTTIDDVLVNPAGSNGKRFLVVSFGLETRSGSVVNELADRDIVVRDAVIRLLSKRTSDELGSIEHRTQIKEEIIAELNGILQKGDIDRLYFTQYLLQ